MDSRDTILIVDDDTMVRDLLHDFLCREGYHVISSGNPHEALEQLSAHPVDLVITDLLMPEMSGMDLLQLIHKQERGIPVIVITGHPTVDTAVKVVKEGGVDFIPKPFSLDHAGLVVRRALEESRIRKRSRGREGSAGESDKVKTISRSLQEKVKELSALYTISEALYKPCTLHELFIKVVEVATSITEAERGGLWVLDGKSGKIALKASKGMENLSNLRIALKDAGRVRTAFSNKESLIQENYTRCLCGGDRYGIKHPFLCAPILIGGEAFAALHLCKKVGGANFTRDDISMISSLTKKTALRIENIALYDNLIDKIMQSTTSLLAAIQARDNYTMNHCKQVTQYAVRLAQCMGCSEEIIDSLRLAGPIHDVGKIGVRDNILLKPGKLNLEEMDIMKTHVEIGDEIIKPLSFGHLECAIVRNHHERFDGGGYPDQFKGTDIPLVARIFSVADTYDAMTTDRPYRAALSHEIAVEEINKYSWQQFDGDIVDVFIDHAICKEVIQAA